MGNMRPAEPTTNPGHQAAKGSLCMIRCYILKLLFGRLNVRPMRAIDLSRTRPCHQEYNADNLSAEAPIASLP